MISVKCLNGSVISFPIFDPPTLHELARRVRETLEVDRRYMVHLTRYTECEECTECTDTEEKVDRDVEVREGDEFALLIGDLTDLLYQVVKDYRQSVSLTTSLSPHNTRMYSPETIGTSVDAYRLQLLNTMRSPFVSRSFNHLQQHYQHLLGAEQLDDNVVMEWTVDTKIDRWRHVFSRLEDALWAYLLPNRQDGEEDKRLFDELVNLYHCHRWIQSLRDPFEM